MAIQVDTGQLTFAKDVRKGLQQKPKQLPSKYFYDERGDQLFQQIMAMPEYYLTDAETAIFQKYAGQWSTAWKEQPFQLVELGAGDGTKTKILIRALEEAQATFSYCPIDISKHVLQELRRELKQEFPGLQVHAQAGDYFQALDLLDKKLDMLPRIFLFLGSNIGNFSKAEARQFLSRFRQKVRPGDRLLIGMDLKKDPQRILDAYNDPQGITAAFNLNLLHRINRELGADFEPAKFKHWETYQPVTGATESFLVSLEAQTVYIREIDLHVAFEAWEAVKVELSQKYTLQEIEHLFRGLGFSQGAHYLDTEGLFVDTFWKIR